MIFGIPNNIIVNYNQLSETDKGIQFSTISHCEMGGSRLGKFA